jgi:tripartite-type tricarboxylate transporter receptor subunit TctC
MRAIPIHKAGITLARTLKIAESIVVILLAALAPFAGAQTYPKQPVRMIVPYSPGTGADILARSIGQKLTERWGQTVVVENKVGASGNIGTAAAAHAAPDGYTILMNVNSHVINKSVFKDPQYDPIKDFTPVTLTAWGRLLLVVHPSTHIEDVKTLIREAKAHPGKLNFASPGIGTPHHVAMELFKLQTGTDLFHVPHKATASALTDMLGGQVQAMFIPIHVGLPHVRAGRLNAIGMGSPKRAPSAPEIPTLLEQGVKGVDTDMWYGVLTPAGVSREIVAQLNRDVRAVLAVSEFRANLAKQGLEATVSTPEEFGKLIRTDLVRWQHVVEKAKIAANE